VSYKSPPPFFRAGSDVLEKIGQVVLDDVALEQHETNRAELIGVKLPGLPESEEWRVNHGVRSRMSTFSFGLVATEVLIPPEKVGLSPIISSVSNSGLSAKNAQCLPMGAGGAKVSQTWIRRGSSEKLASTLQLDMAHWFRPTAANYFSWIGKTDILAALWEAKGATAPAWEKVRKADLAVLAEQRIAGTDWLPELPRGLTPASATDLKDANQKRGRGRFRPASLGHAPPLRRVVLNRQGTQAARARLSTGPPTPPAAPLCRPSGVNIPDAFLICVKSAL
jgi:hypothetical protein